jgi:Mg2+ and Co2+ transporter CorA
VQIFNLIHQNDAGASIQLAKSAKEDAASMKFLALVTLFFLPGTFFATLFAVPSLNWSSDDGVISSRFWIYWAFTLPCTILLVIFYKGWTISKWFA